MAETECGARWCAALQVVPDASVEPADWIAWQPPTHEYAHQIALDVPRSFHFDEAQSWDLDARRVWERKLAWLLHTVVAESERRDEPAQRIHYSQGLNDVASVLLLVAGPAAALPLLRRVTRSFLRGFLRADLADALEILDLLPHLLRRLDEPLAARVELTRLVSLPWLLTWFAHDFDSLDDARALYDFCLHSHPLAPVFIAAEILRARRTAILAAEEDPAELHHLIASLPREHVQVHAVLGAAWRAMVLVDPATLTTHLSRATLDAWPELELFPFAWEDGHDGPEAGLGAVDRQHSGVGFRARGGLSRPHPGSRLELDEIGPLAVWDVVDEAQRRRRARQVWLVRVLVFLASVPTLLFLLALAALWLWELLRALDFVDTRDVPLATAADSLVREGFAHLEHAARSLLELRARRDL